MDIVIRRAVHDDKNDWFRMRKGIWPEAPDEYLGFDMDEILESEQDAVFFGLIENQPVGLIEARIRDFAEGCETSPVGYVESWFVQADQRGRGMAAALMQAAENWARDKGCTEIASDTWLDNEAGIRAHLKLGYSEVERLVHFVKQL